LTVAVALRGHFESCRPGGVLIQDIPDRVSRGRSKTEVARDYRISRCWEHQLVQRFPARAGWLVLCGWAGDAIADAWGGGDDRRVAELAPQAADGDRDGVGERVGVLVPRLLEQAFGAEVGGAGAQQRLQNCELLD